MQITFKLQCIAGNDVHRSAQRWKIFIKHLRFCVHELLGEEVLLNFVSVEKKQPLFCVHKNTEVVSFDGGSLWEEISASGYVYI